MAPCSRTLIDMYDSKPQHEHCQRRTQKVRFAEYHKVIDVLHINDMSEEEVKGSYLNPDELRTIKKDCMVLIRKIIQADCDIKTFCTRGLDQHTPSYSKWRKQIRNKLYHIVFRIQEDEARLSHLGVCVPDMLSRLCRKHSLDSVIAAAAVGISDAKTARRVRV